MQSIIIEEALILKKNPNVTAAYKIILFVLGSVLIVWVSRPSMRNPQQHGFYRFFSWEAILVLFLLNVEYWFLSPFSPRQVLSWLFLVTSLALIAAGVHAFRTHGELDPAREDSALVGIERTTRLVTGGIYRYIRHPFYSSLLCLGWGIFLKSVTWVGLMLALANTLVLFITARKEEQENIQYFGEPYMVYMQGTSMFIPNIF